MPRAVPTPSASRFSTTSTSTGRLSAGGPATNPVQRDIGTDGCQRFRRPLSLLPLGTNGQQSARLHLLPVRPRRHRSDLPPVSAAPGTRVPRVRAACVAGGDGEGAGPPVMGGGPRGPVTPETGLPYCVGEAVASVWFARPLDTAQQRGR